MSHRPIRILHVIDGLGGGGAERFICELVRRAEPSTAVHRVVTFYPDDGTFVFAKRLSDLGAYSSSLADRHPRAARVLRQARARLFEGLPQVAKHLIRDTKSARRDARGCLTAAVAFARFRPDVIHGHLFWGLSVGAWLKRLTRRPLVYSIWNHLGSLPGSGAPWLVDDYRRLHPEVDRFLTDAVSRDEVGALGIPRHKVHTFDAQVDLAAVRAAVERTAEYRAEVRRELGVPSNAPIVLSVGRLHTSKGHDYALRALPEVLRRHSDVYWVALGEGPERPALEDRIRELGLGHRARLVGYVERPHRYYAAADLYLRTHLTEGENTASMDAMAFGLPVVGFDTGCGTDVLGTARHGVLVPMGRVEGLVDGVDRILAEPDRGRGIGARGAEYARTYLDIDIALTLFNRTYADLWTGRRFS